MKAKAREVLGTALGVCVFAASASAQFATLFVSHDDPDGVVAPGETVRFTVTMDWTGAAQILQVLGDIAASPGIGSVSDIERPSPRLLSLLPHYGSAGAPASGGLAGVDLQFVPYLYTGGGWAYPCPSLVPGLGTFLSWEWTAPAPAEPTLVEFGFEPAPGTTGVWGTPSLSAVVGQPLPTTYTGASLLVIPAPSAPAGVLAGFAYLARRRRQHTRHGRGLVQSRACRDPCTPVWPTALPTAAGP